MRKTLFLAPALLALQLAAPPELLAAKESLTLWWVIFNNPAACDGGCGADDFANPAVQASVVYASGQIARANGKVMLVASLNRQARGFQDELLGGPGLRDPEAAEIHMVVRSHGRRIAAGKIEQITQFLEAGCADLGGPNTCVDVQFAIHGAGAQGPSDVFWFPDFHGGSAVSGASSTLIRQNDGVRVVVESDVK